MTFAAGDPVIPATVTGTNPLSALAPFPKLGVIESTAAGVSVVLWEDGRRVTDIDNLALRKVVPADAAELAAAPVGRPVRQVGAVQEARFAVLNVLRAEEDTADPDDSEVLALLVNLPRDGSLGSVEGSSFVVNAGAPAGAVAALEAFFGAAPAFNGTVFAAEAIDKWPRY